MYAVGVRWKNTPIRVDLNLFVNITITLTLVIKVVARFIAISGLEGGTRDGVKGTRTGTERVVSSTMGATRAAGGRSLLRMGRRSVEAGGRLRGRAGREETRLRHCRGHMLTGRRSISGQSSMLRRHRGGLATGRRRLHRHRTGMRRLDRGHIRRLRQVSKLASRRTGRCLLGAIRSSIGRSATGVIERLRARTGRRTSGGTGRCIIGTVREYTTSRITRAAVSMIRLPDSRVGKEVVNERKEGVEALRALANIRLVVSSAPRTIMLSKFSPVHQRITEVTLRHLVISKHVRPTEVRRVIRGTRGRISAVVHRRKRTTTLSIKIAKVRPRLVHLLKHVGFEADCKRGTLGRSVRITRLSNLVTKRVKLSIELTGHTKLLRSVNGSVSRSMRKSRVRVNSSLYEGCGRSTAVVGTIRTRRNSIRPRDLVTYIIRTTSAVSTTEPKTEERAVRACAGELGRLRSVAGRFGNMSGSFTVRTNERVHIVMIPRRMSSSSVILLTESVTGRVRFRLRCPKRVGMGIVHRSQTASCTGWRGRGEE